MKYEPGPTGSGIPVPVPETDDEKAAVAYLEQHVPLFAGASEYMIEAYLAAVKRERAEQTAKIRDLCRRWRNRASAPGTDHAVAISLRVCADETVKELM